MTGKERKLISGPTRGKRFALVAGLVLVLGSLTLLFGQNAAAASITVPYGTSVADADLDGYPATGAWGDALSTTIPLENAAAAPYGSATLFAKHDGTFVYFRIDGSIDVPWSSATGNHFWLGMQISPTGTSHHGSGTWDGVFLGLWDGTSYTPQPTYPPSGVDTNGFSRPPAKDAVQDVIGKMRYSGTAAPYSFTAEWKKKLNTGDASDIILLADGTTTYHFFVTTDSDGGGSAGGVIAHDGVTNSNTIRFAVPSASNTPPVVDLTAPNGAEVWSGGSSHKVWWNMSDNQTATSALKAWINYSSDGGVTYSPIAGAQGITGLSNPCSFAWTLPTASTTQARVRVVVADAQGALASDASLANFAVDATAPSVTAFNPANGATGVSATTQVRVSFSEAMNQPSAQQAFSLTRVDTGAPVTGSFGWSANDLLFTPSTALSQGVVYRALVGASALDASNPGNPLGVSSSASFAIVDLTPPTITSVTAVPSSQQAGGRVNVSAVVSDNGVLSGVWIEIRAPAGAVVANVTASYDPVSGRHFYDTGYAHPGTYSYRISAKDAAGNWNVATGTFVVVDTVAPTIQHVPVTQALANVPIQLTATVTDVDAVQDARVDYTNVLGVRSNVSMIPSGTVYTLTIPAQGQLGTLTYFIWARDPSGNTARTPSQAVPVVGSDTTPPVIANLVASPPIQNATRSVNVSAHVSDNIAVAQVSLLVTDPQGRALGNFSMLRLAGTETYYDERPYTDLGTYGFILWALDGSNNAASAIGSFRIVDLLPPVFQAVSVTPSVVEAGQAFNVSAIVVDNVAVSGVRMTLRGPTGTVLVDQALLRSASLFWVDVTLTVLGNLSLSLTASDALGNVASHQGNVSVVDTQAPIAVAGPAVTVWKGSLVTFNGSASHDNSRIVNFTWSFAYNGTGTTLFGPVTSFVFSIVGRYNVTLTVLDAAGLSGTSATRVTVLTDTTPPPAPRNLVIYALAPACLRVTWDASNASDLAGYRLYRWNRTRSTFDLIANLPWDATTYTDCGLEDNTVYSYWVLAFDSSGNPSPPSPIDNGRTYAPASNTGALEPVYETVIAILAVAVLILTVLWVEERRRKRPPGPGPR